MLPSVVRQLGITIVRVSTGVGYRSASVAISSLFDYFNDINHGTVVGREGIREFMQPLMKTKDLFGVKGIVR